VLATAKFVVDDGTATGNFNVSGAANIARLCGRRWDAVVAGFVDRIVVVVEPGWANGYENIEGVGEESEDDADGGIEEVLAGVMRQVAVDRKQMVFTVRYPYWPRTSQNEDSIFDFDGSAFRHGIVREVDERRVVVEKATVMFPYLNAECMSIEGVDTGAQIRMLVKRNK
jgi:hypothetical protein